MKFAYIIGPYQAEYPYQVDLNIINTKKVGMEIALLGLFPILPHVNTAYMDGIQDDAFWLKGTLELLRNTADVLILIPGWLNNSGTQKEIYEACFWMDLPIYEWPEQINEIKIFTRS